LPGVHPTQPRETREVVFSGIQGIAAFHRQGGEAGIRREVAGGPERFVRHVQTPHDELLASGLDRVEARRRVEEQVRLIPAAWQRLQRVEIALRGGAVAPGTWLVREDPEAWLRPIDWTDTVGWHIAPYKM